MMDATQMICDSILESEEEEHEEEHDDRGDPLGKLCILKNEHIPEKECLLYLGDNVLGRDPNACSLPLLAPSVSKQHATISLSVYRRKGSADEVEALLWDLGSMNGTRKGHLKLTPNVRYALSEGDSLVVADIPCKYMKCSAEADTRTPVSNNHNIKVSDALRENGGSLSTEKTKSTAASTKNKDPFADSGVTQGTPARTGRLSFEQTPTPQHGSLVPDSESESDEENSRVGNRRQKAIVSDSDSYKSSPTCSTFISPTNKVVPESEDESPITPSSSHKNRTRRVSFNTEESDVDIHRQEQKNPAALEIVDDSEEETGNEATTDHNSCAQPEQAEMESSASTKANAVSQFNMESDTDVEEEEAEMLSTAAPPALSNNAQVTHAPEFHMDSDTDVEDDETDKPLILSNSAPKNSQVIPVVQPKGLSMDSDTDVEEEGEKHIIAAPPVTSNNAPVISNGAQASNVPEFNMDSDTDVEDEDLLSTVPAKSVGQQSANSAMASEPANADNFNLDSDTDAEEGKADINSNVANANGGGTPQSDLKPVVSKPAAPSTGVHFESDTDEKGISSAAVSEPPVESEKPDLEILSNSDTDVEDNSPEIQPSVLERNVPKCHVLCEAGTDVNEPIVGQSEGENPAAVTADSDTDVEETVVKEKGDNKVPVLQREITPEIQSALQQNCSTPIQQSGGNVEEMETQAFLSPSPSSYRRAVGARKSDTFSSGLGCQEQDFTVAETQSFILNDRSHNTPLEENPNVSSDLESSVNEKDVSNTSKGHFQLELSDSSVLQAQALAMESTQAFVSMNLEETQPYADAITSGESEGPVDLALQATQAYIPQPCSHEEEEEDSEEDRSTGKDQEVDQSVPQSSHERESEEEEATQPAEYLSAAPTQPMCFDEDSDGEVCAPEFNKRKQMDEEETRQLTSVALAETQPMEIMEDSATDDETPVFRKKNVKPIEEEETQPNSDLTVAQTQPMETMADSESDEDSPVFKKRKAKQLVEEPTQPLETPKAGDSDDEDSFHNFRRRKVKRLEPMEDTQPSEELTVAPTQPIPATETEESTGEDSAQIVRKSQTRKHKMETTASDICVAPTQPVVFSEDITSDEEEAIPAPRKRKARKLEDTQLLTNSQADVEDPRPSGGEASTVNAGLRTGGSVKEKTEEEVISQPQKRQTRGKSKGRRRRAKIKSEDDSDSAQAQMDDGDAEEDQQVKQRDRETAAKLQKEEEERKRQQEERERREKEERERVEKERIEQEEMAARLQKEREENEKTEREERERMEKEKKDKEERERLKRERVEKAKELEAERQKEKREREEKEKREKEQEEMERLERERIEKELEAQQKEKEQKEKIEREKREREEKAKVEKQERERLEKERTEREKKELAAKRKKDREEEMQKEMLEKRERVERERKEKEEREERERMEAAKKDLEEKKRLEKEKQEELKAKEEAPSRGRRASRRTTAAPSSSKAADDDGPALRTRSRSNSSNSVGSERSVSSVSPQAGRGRGRGRGAPKVEEAQPEKAPVRGRRRTVAGTEASLSRSNSSTSLNSEVSVGSVSSRGRGRGGRQRGGGRRTEGEVVSSQKAPQRGRKSSRIHSEDDNEDKAGEGEPSVSTRGQGGAKDQTRHTPEEDGKESSQEEASTSRRGGRKRDAETETETKTEEEGDSSLKRKTGVRNTQSRKSVKVEAPEDDAAPIEKPKGRGRASAVQRKKSDEQGDSGSSGNNSMEQEGDSKGQEPPQTPRSGVSRKRQSADSESDPVAKTPRSSTTSPNTVGRSRTPNQSYKVLFTGVVDEAGEKVLSRLGGSLAKDVANMNCLVTDKVRRTVKFLCAVAKGIPIVTTQWLEKSGKAGTFLSPNAFLVKDREQENKFNFNLQDSLRVASGQPLLQGYEIHVTKSVKPEPVHMKDIITSSGAVFLSRMPSSNKPKTLVISCEEDWSLCAPALSCSVPVVSAEFILTGILQQKVDLETHKLSGPASAQGARGKGRKKT